MHGDVSGSGSPGVGREVAATAYPREKDGQSRSKTIFYVQPLIARYRVEVIETLNRMFVLKVFASAGDLSVRGFSHESPVCEEFIDTKITAALPARIKIQSMVLKRMIKERPVAVNKSHQHTRSRASEHQCTACI